MIKRIIYYILFLLLPSVSFAQVGEHRSNLSVGFHGGANLNTISFLPKVNQKMHIGKEFGFMVRYTCEKYFNTICSIQGEINYSQLGWNEDIIDKNDNPVPSLLNGSPEFFKKNINYIQVPVMAHLAWGKEKKGFNFFFNAGPQFGVYLSEDQESNFTPQTANYAIRSSSVVAQDTMTVENKFDYGICAGLGVEAHIRHIGRLQLEARYYYGLGNIYGDSKRDYFATSNHSTITIRAAYLFDLF